MLKLPVRYGHVPSIVDRRNFYVFAQVFGPSQQCFNAISFVISVSQDYSEVFDNLIALMERLSAFMEKLRSYLDDPRAEEKLDQRLR